MRHSCPLPLAPRAHVRAPALRVFSRGISLWVFSRGVLLLSPSLRGGVFFSLPFPGGRIFRLFLFFIYFFSLFLLSEGGILSFSFLLRSTLFLFFLLGVTLGILSVDILSLSVVFFLSINTPYSPTFITPYSLYFFLSSPYKEIYKESFPPLSHLIPRSPRFSRFARGIR